MISWSRGRHIGFFFLEIEKGPGLPITSGYADGHIVQMYVSITNTEGVIYIYCHFNDFTKSRRPYWNYVLEIIRGPGPPSTSGYADGHWVQMYVSITKYGRSYGHFNDFMKWRWPYWIFKNAIGRNFAHPPENVVLDHYEFISIDRKSLYNNST